MSFGNREDSLSSNRLFITDKKSLLISYPMEFLPLNIAAIDVVPLPKNGSNTVSPTNVNISIALLGNSTGNIAI